MARTEGDSWDLTSSVGATATMVAAARAIASREPAPLIDDPYAAPLVRAVGIEFFTKVVAGEIDYASGDDSGGASLMTDVMAVRTRFFDDFFADACGAGPQQITQAVILASGLDSRAYRLDWPTGTTVFEIDQPAVIEFKTATLAALGAQPAAQLHTVAVDLRDDWPAALREAGFDADVPTAWIAEGLLVYLPPDAQDRLFDEITHLSAPGSRLATEYHPDAGASIGERGWGLRDQFQDQGLDLDVASLFHTAARRFREVRPQVPRPRTPCRAA
ncbi:class I SAM-dependent methyltransferase [Mycobacterium sp. SMC-8]|nr:class I SAM-dependent methyltransferase [Mycobacterium sp. SMC-8]